ncbi:hypothetical protein F383_34255 [Gossypium arboreum]|uniref:Uncharacterized protein n=1 Tax=Gossypium arboreum TaxID=29729 RepID=A0A0B0N8K4_GOSAR|nr:hypothetical protein F383_34255 [Gossypium arboreum]
MLVGIIAQYVCMLINR